MQLNLTNLNYLPIDEQKRIHQKISQIICETFILTADRDYLTARFAFFQKQSHLFLWSAAQAVEKYLKANILLFGAGVDIKQYKHSLTKLSTELGKSHPLRLKIDTCVPEGWFEQGVPHWLALDSAGFLRRLEVTGSPDIRYDQQGVDTSLQDLVLLDRLVFALRDGLLPEQVIECRHVSKLLIDCFYDFNFPFAPVTYQHPPVLGLRLMHLTVPTLEIALNGGYGRAELYKEWAEKSLGISKKKIKNLFPSNS